MIYLRICGSESPRKTKVSLRIQDELPGFAISPWLDEYGYES